MAKSKAASSLLLVAMGVLACLPTMLHAQQPDRFSVQQVAQFQVPWAREFLPDGRLLVSEGDRPGLIH